MSEEDFKMYFEAYSKIQDEIPKPDVIIFLRTSSEVLLERIKRRGRDYEKDIEQTYLDIINDCYEEYVEMMHSKYGVEVIIIETSEQSQIQVGQNVSQAIKNSSNDILLPLVIA